MNLRHLVARWLAPDVFDRADRHSDLLATIDHEHRWLSEFDEVAAALDRLRQAAPIEISKFRDELRGLVMRRHVMARRGMVADLAYPAPPGFGNHRPTTMPISPSTAPPNPRKK